MADATVKAWRCDVCGDIFAEGQHGYDQKYGFNLSLNKGFRLEFEDLNFPDVCTKCAEEIVKTIDVLGAKEEG